MGAGAADYESYTMHTPKNFLRSWANEMSFTNEEKNPIGHWQSGSRMCERYDRSTCAQELLIRNITLQNIVSGWSPVGPFSIPHPAPVGRGRTPLVGSNDACAGVDVQLAQGVFPSPSDSTLRVDTPEVESSLPVFPNLG